MNNEVSKTESSMIVCLGGKKYVPVSDFNAASNVIQNLISVNAWGGTDYYKRKDIGKILHPDNGYIAYVSYNGRIWDAITEKPIA